MQSSKYYFMLYQDSLTIDQLVVWLAFKQCSIIIETFWEHIWYFHPCIKEHLSSTVFSFSDSFNLLCHTFSNLRMHVWYKEKALGNHYFSSRSLQIYTFSSKNISINVMKVLNFKTRFCENYKIHLFIQSSCLDKYI